MSLAEAVTARAVALAKLASETAQFANSVCAPPIEDFASFNISMATLSQELEAAERLLRSRLDSCKGALVLATGAESQEGDILKATSDHSMERILSGLSGSPDPTDLLSDIITDKSGSFSSLNLVDTVPSCLEECTLLTASSCA
jgi:hypothetical protein